MCKRTGTSTRVDLGARSRAQRTPQLVAYPKPWLLHHDHVDDSEGYLRCKPKRSQDRYEESMHAAKNQCTNGNKQAKAKKYLHTLLQTGQTSLAFLTMELFNRINPPTLK